MSQVASKYLRESDFKALETLILESATLDNELSAVLDRMPKYFHMGLLPSIRTGVHRFSP